MSHTFTNLLSHIIFSTKERIPLLVAEIEPDLFAYLGGIVRELGGIAMVINGTSDHVHMLIRIPATIAIAEAMRVIKTNSSRWVHEKWSMHSKFSWQTGYGAFSVSQSNVTSVLKYIASQKEHHRRVSFQEEFITFLKKNDIEYDERYIWE